MLDIRQEVIKQLDRFYNPIPIYGEAVSQGFEEPSFFVKVLDGSREQQLDRRYIHEVSLDIHYFTTSNKDAEQTANNLYEQMEVLEAIKIKGKNMKHEVSDKVLHFFIDYKVHLIKQAKQYPKMKRLEVNAYGK
ncbi:hypothetical protein PBV87_00880 [Niameybacter massiliensis]|uniref:Phage protein n=1 Tax=Holtiella tumoricola TaxID=3018743 RepID=A0AA42IYJ1_9FIRM|nr:hypothetical protein [Holtiella tumoricola]MDA3730067.1 hypothetical protein [Holtiella tumoricola]